MAQVVGSRFGEELGVRLLAAGLAVGVVSLAGPGQDAPLGVADGINRVGGRNAERRRSPPSAGECKREGILDHTERKANPSLSPCKGL